MESIIHDESFMRTRYLLGEDFLRRAAEVRIILFGVGGVGSWCAESLVRTGFRHLTIVDFDTVATSNINRQLPATSLTVGESKVEAMKRRLLEISPSADIRAIDGRFSRETAEAFHLEEYDIVVDAIDSLDDKAFLILEACRLKKTLFSSMGAAKKWKPWMVKKSEFWKVTGCPLAAALRRRFKKSGEFPARKFQCVYSDEQAQPGAEKGSLSQVTGVFGLYLTALITEKLINQ